ncbi:uncharacterized protein MELLADRAFT_117981 [Melampsora larici-populina 98AG31]|uniref:Uncharacterized protein n=1 Tax=Melampsora larici-populina (strain 98AG31 / pathotype 3-4-7) TaxID=747676 RepID=F4S3Q8_MELLP|nr:uncharacterized protein MELLADRAFT_117981 [Melampsora larici-populina 98AG31]EGG00716.1 hypothetical protein MELLADRAFT_117981 [Melampsora larici-populina 98AG31]
MVWRSQEIRALVSVSTRFNFGVLGSISFSGARRMSSRYDENPLQEWRRSRSSIPGDGEGDGIVTRSKYPCPVGVLTLRNRLPPPTNLVGSLTRQILRPGPHSPSQVNRARDYFGPTCPSYNKLDPLTSNEMSSRSLLSKFLSQPDNDSRSGTWSDRYESTNSSQFQPPDRSSWDSRDIGERRNLAQGSREQERRRDEVHGSSDAPAPNMSRLQYSDIHSHDEEDNQATTSQGTSAGAADIHPIRLVNRYGEEEFR